MDLRVEHPHALFLLLLLPLLPILRRRTREKLPFTCVTPLLIQAQPTFWKKHYEDFLSVVVLGCLILSIANIGYSQEMVEEYIESKWIMLAVDLSGSMKRQASASSEATLEDLALEGVEAFVDMRDREDAVGIVVFSSHPRLLAPLSFDKRLLKKKLDLIKMKNQSRVYRELSAGGGTNASDAVWLSLSVFFSMLPEKDRLTVDEIAGMRELLFGNADRMFYVPEKLKKTGFGRGMAVIVFTDGRIEPTLRAHSAGGRQSPNLVSVIRLMKEIGVKLYIIAVGGDVDEAVIGVMESDEGMEKPGAVFVPSGSMDRESIRDVYEEINRLEANRILSRIISRVKWTGRYFAFPALGLMMVHFLMRNLSGFRRI